VQAVVFYDENGNGLLDTQEGARVPDVTVSVAGQTARSAAVTGIATVGGVAEGAQTASVRADTLPPFYRSGAPVAITVPSSATVMLPVTLPIGGNRPNTYMAFGDSLTAGEGSSDGNGYRARLQSRLQAHFGRGEVVNEGVFGGRTPFGVGRLGAALSRHRPAYTLVLYGTNDWNMRECKEAFPCFTIDNLRRILQDVRAASSLPVLVTIPPVNVGFDIRSPPARDDWVTRMDELIRPLAAQEGAVLADAHAAFLRAGAPASALFVDHVHPNDRGYEILADELFRALTAPSGTAASTLEEVAPGIDAPALLAPPEISPRRRGGPDRLYHRTR
jgi:lysophospholipase L1-like esterase